MRMCVFAAKARVAILRRLLSCLPGRAAANSTVRHQSTICPVTTLTQEEEMMRDTGSLMAYFGALFSGYTVPLTSVVRFANEKIKPLVREMDECSQMDKSVIKGLFENGVRCTDNFGIQVSFRNFCEIFC